MLKEIVLTALIALTPVEKKALNEFQIRLKKDGYDISQYIEDPRFGIYRFEKGGEKFINYADTTQSWYMKRDSLEKCADFIEEHYYWLKKVQDKHGPSPEHITSVLQLETNRGQYTGEFPLLVAFASVYIDRPDRRNEYLKYTKDFLDLFADTTDNIVFPKDIFGVKGSWAGAFGIAQGMPYIIKKYGSKADGDGDGVVNLLYMPDATDFLGLILKDNGFNKNPSEAIQRYNNGHKFYGPAIDIHKDSLEKIMERRRRIPPKKINYKINPAIIDIKPPRDNTLQDMEIAAMLPKIPPKQPFIKRIFSNRKTGKR
jgi:hypothetical protein